MNMNYITWLIHFLSYNISWISCVYFASIQQAYTGPLITFILLILQIFWQEYHHLKWKAPFMFALCLGFLGSLVDTFWLYQDFIFFNANPFHIMFSPPWMISLWVSFGFNYFLHFEPFFRHYFITGFLIFISLPFAYWVGIQIGAAILTGTYFFYFYLGLTWSVVIPILSSLYQQKIPGNK